MVSKKIIIPLIAIFILLSALAAVLFLIDDKESDMNTSDVVSSSAGDTNTSEADVEIKGYIFDVDSDGTSDISPQSVSYISIKYGNENYSFSKQDGTWKYHSNSNVSISPTAVEVMVNALCSTGYTKVFADGSIPFGDCNINENSDVIEFDCELGKMSLTKGMTLEDGSYYMASGLSDSVYLVDAASVNAIFKSLSSYRNSAMLRVDFDNISEITIVGDESIVLKKGSSDVQKGVYYEWKMESPVKISANDEYVRNKIINPLKSIKVMNYTSDNGDYEKFGLASKDRYVTIKDASGESATVYFSRPNLGISYIAVDDEITIYEVNVSSSPYTNLRAIDIASRNIHLAKMDNITNVTIKGDGKDYNVEFASDSGKVNGKKVEYKDLNSTIFPAVCGIIADDIVTEGEFNSLITITYNYKSGNKDVVKFSDYNERYYLVSKNDSIMFVIQKSKIEDLCKILDNYK